MDREKMIIAKQHLELVCAGYNGVNHGKRRSDRLTSRSFAKAEAFLLLAPVASRFLPLPLVSASLAAISASCDVSTAVVSATFGFFFGGGFALGFGSGAFLFDARVALAGAFSSRFFLL